jgi:DNA-binding transcriptional regulator LsrR (DeoR family)
MEKILLTAELYYTYGMCQKEIAAKLRISRSWVSKLLKRAIETGVVHIRVDTYTDGMDEIEQRLIKKFGLRNAKIVKTLDREQTAEHCANVAAHYLVSEIRPNDVIGISWGATIAGMFNHTCP